MTHFRTKFAQRLARSTGALELMQDLGSAAASVSGNELHMLGGGNPARIAAVEDVYRRRLLEIATDSGQFGRFAASYSAPAGDLGVRCAVAEALERQYGWHITGRNVALTSGS